MSGRTAFGLPKPDVSLPIPTGVIPIILSVLAWEVLAQNAIVPPQFFPPPSEIAVAYVDQMIYGDMQSHLWASLQRVVLAFLIGGGGGIALGLVMGASKPVRLVLNPYLGMLYPVPKVVLLPIMFALIGVNEFSRVLTMAIAVSLLVSINTIRGVLELDEAYVEAARDNGASTLAMYRDVIIPGALPQIFSGISLGFGVGLILIVVIEMVAAGEGLGYVIWNSWQLFTVKRLYVSLVTINLLGVIFVYGAERVGDRLTPWVN